MIPTREARLIELAEAWRERAIIAEANLRVLRQVHGDLRASLLLYREARVAPALVNERTD